MVTVGGFTIVALAAAGIASLLTYCVEELRHDRIDRVREESSHALYRE